MAVDAPPRRFRMRRTTAVPPPVQITAIGVKDLFGKYTYDNVPINAETSQSGRVSVIYGDNGTGKTTVLRLLYAILSHERAKGLRSYVAKTPFKEFFVNFSDGRSIAVKKDNLQGSYNVIFSSGHEPDFAIYVEARPDFTVHDSDAAEAVEQRLERLNLDVLFVDHNRVVQSTYAFLSDIRGSASEQQLLIDAGNHAASYERLYRSIGPRLKETDLQFPLPQVVSALESAFRALAFRQGTVGDQGAASVYLDIVKSITKDRRRADVPRQNDIVDVVSTLESLKIRTESFIRHGLLSEYPFDNLIALYSSASRAKRAQIEAVLSPFLDTIHRRLIALDEVHRRITVLETELSRYLSNKAVSFHILNGLQISDDGGSLNLEALSSGERQLIFLLCSAAVSRDKRSLILIDEPELSLNFKWQRMIAGSLSNISSGGETQYILASHSIEIITRYVDSAFELPTQ